MEAHWHIPFQILRRSIASFRIFTKNKILPYSKIYSPVFVIRAGKYNFRKGDKLLPNTAINVFKKKLKKIVFLALPDKNHYEVILLPDFILVFF